MEVLQHQSFSDHHQIRINSRVKTNENNHLFLEIPSLQVIQKMLHLERVCLEYSKKNVLLHEMPAIRLAVLGC